MLDWLFKCTQSCRRNLCIQPVDKLYKTGVDQMGYFNTEDNVSRPVVQTASTRIGKHNLFLGLRQPYIHRCNEMS